MASPEQIASLIQGRRMSLMLGPGSAQQLALLSQQALPAVALSPDPAEAEESAQSGLAVFHGSAERLRQQREKFDAVHAAPRALAELSDEAAGELLAQILRDGGLLLLEGRPKLEHPELEARATAGEARLLLRRPRGPRPQCGGLANFADRFVGRQRICELGVGAGRFLAALHVRGLSVSGIEEDPGRALAARANGHEIEEGGPERLRLHPRGFDAIAIDTWDASWSAELQAGLLELIAFALRPGGILGIRRCEQPLELLPDTERLELDDRADRDGFVFLRRDDSAELDVPGATRLPRLRRSDLQVDRPITQLSQLELCERREYSQGGEDGVLDAIFAHIGTTNRYYVEFGCGDGLQCNTAALRRRGWQGLLMDGVCKPAAEDALIHAEWITAENINALFAKHAVPAQPDLVSIDIDGNDYWVLEALQSRPRVLVAEYNGNLAVDAALSIPYDPEHRWDGSDYYGASLLALTQLAAHKGYQLVYCNAAGVNAFFVREDLLDMDDVRPLAELYRPANYWYRGQRSLPDLARDWQELTPPGSPHST
jgi:hypothetical protein